MLYTGFLLELISNEIEIDYENARHKDIIYNVLLELGVNEKIINNKIVIEEIFESLKKIFGQNVYSNYDKNSFTILNLSREGYNYKTSFKAINGELIINTNIVDIVNVYNETVSYKCIDIWNNIKKHKEFERFDHILAEKNSILFYHIIEDAIINYCGFYTTRMFEYLKKDNLGFRNLTKSNIYLKRIEDYPCILYSENGIRSYVPDLGDIDMLQSKMLNKQETIEKACQQIPKNLHEIEKNIEKNTEEDYDGQIKNLYKKRYENYLDKTKKHIYKKV